MNLVKTLMYMREVFIMKEKENFTSDLFYTVIYRFPVIQSEMVQHICTELFLYSIVIVKKTYFISYISYHRPTTK